MSQVIKVGVFVTLCLVVLGVLIFRIEDWSLGGDGQRVVAVFDSVAGLNEKAPVRVAGVRVGAVESIGLEGREHDGLCDAVTVIQRCEFYQEQ